MVAVLGFRAMSGAVEAVERSYTGSHRVDVMGSRVIVRDVDLFCAYDPKFDADDDERIGYFTNKVTRAIFEETRDRMERGQYPQIVVRHDRPGRFVEPSSVGRAIPTRYEIRDGVGFIIGDLDMSASDFETYVLSDDYPRRSAEFDPASLRFLANVALLGREAPARPLSDTRFNFESRRESRLVPIKLSRSDHESGIDGGANTFVPGSAKRKDNDMDDKDPMLALHEAISGIAKRIEECDSKNERRFSEMEARFAKFEMKEGDEDETDDDDDKKADHESRRRKSRKASTPAGFVPKSQFEAERNRNADLLERVNEMEAKQRRTHAETLVRDAIDAGFEIAPQREKLIAKLAGLSDEDQIAEFEVIKSVARKSPLDKSMGALHEALGTSRGRGATVPTTDQRLPEDPKQRRAIFDRTAQLQIAAEKAGHAMDRHEAESKAIAEFEAGTLR